MDGAGNSIWSNLFSQHHYHAWTGDKNTQSLLSPFHSTQWGCYWITSSCTSYILSLWLVGNLELHPYVLELFLECLSDPWKRLKSKHVPHLHFHPKLFHHTYLRVGTVSSVWEHVFCGDSVLEIWYYSHWLRWLHIHSQIGQMCSIVFLRISFCTILSFIREPIFQNTWLFWIPWLTFAISSSPNSSQFTQILCSGFFESLGHWDRSSEKTKIHSNSST